MVMYIICLCLIKYFAFHCNVMFTLLAAVHVAWLHMNLCKTWCVYIRTVLH